MIVGGGSGGMEYALHAQEAGHEVTVFEKDQTLGGAMAAAHSAGHPPGALALLGELLLVPLANE